MGLVDQHAGDGREGTATDRPRVAQHGVVGDLVRGRRGDERHRYEREHHAGQGGGARPLPGGEPVGQRHHGGADGGDRRDDPHGAAGEAAVQEQDAGEADETATDPEAQARPPGDRRAVDDEQHHEQPEAGGLGHRHHRRRVVVA